MVVTLSFVFLLVALVLFILAAFGVSTGRINAIGAGLAFLTLSYLIPSFIR